MSRDPLEKTLEIEQAQLRGFARSVAEVEWLLLVLVVLYLFVVSPELARNVEVLGVLGGFTAFVLVFRYARPLGKRTRTKITIEILAMLVFLTAVLAVAGGEKSPLLNLYLLPIVTAALALGKRATALVVAVVCLCYPLLATLTAGSDRADAGPRHRRNWRACAVHSRGLLDDAAGREHPHGERENPRAIGSRRAHGVVQHARLRRAHRARARDRRCARNASTRC